MAALDDAIRLARRVPVFPCAASKKPACPHGFKDAVSDPAAIVDLWRAYPGSLIGVPTGESSGIDALDIDPRSGGAEWLAEAEDSLPPTRRHHTRSGGLHLIFRHTDRVRNTASKIAPGVDTRGTGGYIIWWPAHGCEIENPRTLEDWPKWLLRILIPPRTSAPPPLPATRAEADARAALMIERAFARVRCATPGQRHDTLRAAARTLGGLERFLCIGRSGIERQLVDLIMATGAIDRANAEKTAAWAMEKGSDAPLLK